MAESRRNYSKSQKKILVIDDDVEYLKMIKIYLRDYYDVMSISTTRTAIEYLSENAPDAILVDYYMPLYNGADIIKIIKNSSMARGSRIVLVSGSMDARMLNECINLGLDSAISKAASKDEILMKLHQVLEV